VKKKKYNDSSEGGGDVGRLVVRVCTANPAISAAYRYVDAHGSVKQGEGGCTCVVSTFISLR
jgi:hypothetical protein